VHDAAQPAAKGSRPAASARASRRFPASRTQPGAVTAKQAPIRARTYPINCDRTRSPIPRAAPQAAIQPDRRRSTPSTKNTAEKTKRQPVTGSGKRLASSTAKLGWRAKRANAARPPIELPDRRRARRKAPNAASVLTPAKTSRKNVASPGRQASRMPNTVPAPA
jgi:hypothetical protein